jgi:hypothetical protein
MALPVNADDPEVDESRRRLVSLPTRASLGFSRVS